MIRYLKKTIFQTTYMTPYDVAVIKSSNECERYLKSLGGVSGPEAISKLQTQKQTNSKSKITNSETTNKNTKKSDRTNEKSTTGMLKFDFERKNTILKELFFLRSNHYHDYDYDNNKHNHR